MYKVIDSNGKYELADVFASYRTKEQAEKYAEIFNSGEIPFANTLARIWCGKCETIDPDYPKYVWSCKDPSNKVTPELFEMALAAANIEIDPDITKQVLGVIDLLEKKGESATLEELIKIGNSEL